MSELNKKIPEWLKEYDKPNRRLWESEFSTRRIIMHTRDFRRYSGWLEKAQSKSVDYPIVTSEFVPKGTAYITGPETDELRERMHNAMDRMVKQMERMFIHGDPEDFDNQTYSFWGNGLNLDDPGIRWEYQRHVWGAMWSIVKRVIKKITRDN